MTKDFLFVVSLHGDEPIGIKLCQDKDLKVFSMKFDWIIGNPAALKNKKRYIDNDLNRVFPGDLNSKSYENRRASEILDLSKKYRYVFDIHGAKSNTGIFIIVSNPISRNLQLAKKLDIKNIVIWESYKKSGPLTKFVKCGLEIECGPQDVRTYKILKKIILKFFKNIKNKESKQEFFEVYGKLKKDESSKLENFKKTKVNDEFFYPLLPKQYPGITCYKMIKSKRG